MFSFEKYLLDAPEEMEELKDFKEHIVDNNDGTYGVDLPYIGVLKPNENSFKAKTYILINGGSGSITADFCAIAQFNKIATLIGEETGGCYYGNTSGWSNKLVLPNTEIALTLNYVRYVNAVIGSDSPVGRGVFPDYEACLTIENLLCDNDTVLDFAFDLIRVG